jgi:phage terminase large subunit
MKLDLRITEKQEQFINATQDEVLYGGAAGGGKSHGQLIDALLFALKYPKSRQLILRRTFPELKRSLISKSFEIFPLDYTKYNEANKIWTFVNGSIIEFGYCDSERDVYQYQSAEYNVIRFDELTHFVKEQYTYLISRIRGVNGYPMQIKSTTNPGGVGHSWVKERFIDAAPPNTEFQIKREKGKPASAIFIPAKVQDNKFLMESDPEYVDRLQSLGEDNVKALLYGEWDLTEGQFFSEFKRDIHVVEPFEIDPNWRSYITIDYGLDMLAAYRVTLDNNDNAYITHEIYEGKDKPNEKSNGLLVSEAAERIKEISEGVRTIIAPPDLWNANNQTGKSTALMFSEYGVSLTKANNDRIAGWLAVKERLKVFQDEHGVLTSKAKIFSNCTNLIRTIPALQHDPKKPNDVANQPHELTHAPDAIRYLFLYWISPAKDNTKLDMSKWTNDMKQSYRTADKDTRLYLAEKWKDYKRWNSE